MKDCSACLHREWSDNMRTFLCKNPIIAKRLGYYPRWNIEREDGSCGPEAKYYKDKRDI
jgi:hypothetical protein